MRNSKIRLTPAQARRLAVARQHLSGPQPPAAAEGVLSIFRALGCVQIDPIRAVERTQYLTLWSRLGRYDTRLLDSQLFEHRKLFEYWAHAASIVLTENYPIHRAQARHFDASLRLGANAWNRRMGAWLQANESFRRYVHGEMKKHGPRALSDLEDRSVQNWESSGWTSNRRLGMMVQMMWERGEIMVVERQGSKKKWDLTEHWLPAWTPQEILTPVEASRRSVEISLRALGVGTEKHIRNHFTRGFYPALNTALDQLIAARRLHRAEIAGWPGQWYIHAADLDLLAALDQSFRPRTVLLSPFDNLIADRDRTEQMWDFRYRIEIYVPAAKRQYGYYVLPILHGERLIGRIDPKIDRKTGILHINAVYAEADAPPDAGPAIAANISDLAAWLGAKRIAFGDNLPGMWRGALLAEAN